MGKTGRKMAIQTATLSATNPVLNDATLEFRTQPSRLKVRGVDLVAGYTSEIAAPAEIPKSTFQRVTKDVLRLLHRPWGKRQVRWDEKQWEMLERQSKRHDTHGLMISCGTVTIDKAHTKDRQVLLIWNKNIGVWQLPKGRKHIHEDFSVAALRETREETGVTVRPLYLRFGTRLTVPTNSKGLEDDDFNETFRKRPNRTKDDCDRQDSGIVNVLNKDILYACEYPDPGTGAMRHIYWYAAKPEHGTGANGMLMGKEDAEKMKMRWFPAAEAVNNLKMSVEKEAVALAVYYAEQMSEEEWRYSAQL